MAGMERFTQRARRVLTLAHQEAERARQKSIRTVHLLLGLMDEEGGVAGRVLRELGMSSDRVREVIQRISDSPLASCPDCRREVRRRTSRARAILPGSARGQDEVEQKVADYERQGMYSHAAELADKESEKPEKAPLKERAMENYKKAGYDF